MNSFISLDQLEVVENFHLLFLIQLSRHLGFGPHATKDVLEGFRATREEEQALQSLLDADYGTALTIPYDRRRSLLDFIVAFYQRHIENLGEVRSVDVLKEVLR
jgi:DNA repair protein RecO (recombination protein O)